MKYGYVRVSTVDQKIERQLDAMAEAEIERGNIFLDKKSGKNFDREGYKHVKAKLQAGDLLYVDSLDRLGRDYDGIISEWKEITRKIGADIICLDKSDLFDSRKFKSMGDVGKITEDMLLSAMAYVAEQERKKMLQRQAEGIAAAKARGTYHPGRPSADREKVLEYKKRVDAGQMTVTEAAKAAGVCRRTWYNICG